MSSALGVEVYDDEDDEGGFTQDGVWHPGDCDCDVCEEYDEQLRAEYLAYDEDDDDE